MIKYNLDLLKEQCGNEKAFFNEMLDIFIRSSLEGVANMEEALAGNDMKTLGHYAHKIISPCKHIEADSLVNSLREIEHKAEKSGFSKERAGELVGIVKNDVIELTEALKKEYIQ